MAPKADKELQAMQATLRALSELEPSEQTRVLAWVAEKLKIERLPGGGVGGVRDSGALGAGPTHAPPADTSGASQSAPAATPKAFLAQKRPTTDVERIACLAYYLTHGRNTPQFKTRDLTKLNKEAAQPNFTNAALTARNATKPSLYLAQAGGGRKQITTRGEALVDALPDRDRVKVALEANPLARRYRKRQKSLAKRGK